MSGLFCVEEPTVVPVSCLTSLSFSAVAPSHPGRRISRSAPAFRDIFDAVRRVPPILSLPDDPAYRPRAAKVSDGTAMTAVVEADGDEHADRATLDRPQLLPL